MRARQPKQLLLALLGELVLDRIDDPVRASVLLEVLEGASITAPTARAMLDRMSRRGMLERVRVGREIAFALSDDTGDVLREAAVRVHAKHPFAPNGTGWTLVTFSVPEDQRTIRHRLRATLAWEGFAPLRDGLWIAPGEVDLEAALEPLGDALAPHAVTAFRAEDLRAYPVSRSVREAWDIDAIRAEHERFLETWEASGSSDGAATAVSTLVCLVADWLALLRADPRLPAEFMGEAWPAERSVAAYRARREELTVLAEREFMALHARSFGVVAAPVAGGR
mgnify:CR=1 FL=1